MFNSWNMRQEKMSDKMIYFVLVFEFIYPYPEICYCCKLYPDKGIDYE